MDWISLLKAQQADFIQRVKKTRTYDLSLLESQARGCHSEIIAFWGDSLLQMSEIAHQQAKIVAKNPPPIPSDYPDDAEWDTPFCDYFLQQAEVYLFREQVVERVMSERLGKLVKKIPVDAVSNMVLDDEGNLRGESKFPYLLTLGSKLKIKVIVADSESFNGIRKERIKWSVNQEDLNSCQVLIFLCLFYPFTGSRGYEKQAVIAGFLPSNQIELNEPKVDITPSNLLYAGGLNWYLESLIAKKELQPALDEVLIPNNIETLATNHSLKNFIGDWECVQTLNGHTRGINCLTFSKCRSEGKILSLVASGSRGETKIWDLTQGELIGTFSEYPWITSGQVDEINSLAFSSDGQTLVSGGADSTIKIWHVGANDLIDILHKHNGMVRCVAFTPDGRIFATGGDDRKILFWDLTQRQVVNTLSLEDTAAHSLLFSQDGKTLVTGSYRKIKVWRLLRRSRNIDITNLEGSLQHTFTGHSHIVRALAMSADAKILVSGSRDKTIKVWQLETGELIHTLQGHRDGVYAVALSPDNQIIASGSADKTVKLWHLESGELLGTFAGHANTVTAVNFCQSGQTLVSASLDKTIKIWQKKN
ncbi:MAG: WD40 repeat domain-containing protein [Scytonematopsis contorta HA4267-MV1]|jgi:WD40 repeat protein|nr:WD40 repeat domain-containing protein [Scytonematopsis contorta HA4267-MV1]